MTKTTNKSGWTAGGIQTTIVLYISEISNNKSVILKLVPSLFFIFFKQRCFSCYSIRGRLGSIIQLSRNTGILTAYIVGAIVDYEYIPCIFIFIPVLYVVCFVCLPNTPQYYLQKNRIQVRRQIISIHQIGTHDLILHSR